MGRGYLREFKAVWLAPVAYLATVMMLSLGLIMTQGAGTPGELTVAVFPPWWGELRAAAAVAEIGTPIAAFGPVPWMVVTVAENTSTANALRDIGAIALLNAAAARLCGA